MASFGNSSIPSTSYQNDANPGISGGAGDSRHSSTLSSRKENNFVKCPRCKEQYDFLRRANTNSKVPLILSCKHTVCEDCIRRLCMTNAAACPVCKENFVVPRSKINSLTDIFSPHFALIGHLVWNKNKTTMGHVHWIPAGARIGMSVRKSQASIADISDTTSETEEISDMESVGGYTENQNLPLEFSKCPEHNDFLNIRCETCSTTICVYCFLENHRSHTPTYLYKIGKEQIAEMEQLKTDMKVVLHHLKTSLKKTKQIKNWDLTHVGDDIKKYFADLHAKVHVVERNMIKKLETFQSEGPNLDMVNAILKPAISRVAYVLHCLNIPNKSQVNMKGLYQEILDLKEIPCRLASDSGALNSVEFFYGDRLDDLEENFYLERRDTFEYSLVPMENSTEQQPPLNTKQVTKVTSVRAPQVEENHSLNVKNKPNDIKRVFPSIPENKKTKITLSHLNDLNSFYVQMEEVHEQLVQLNQFIEKKTKRKLNADDLKLGYIYAVKFENKNEVVWRRGQLVNLIKNEAAFVCYVFFIDYGNTHLVTIDKLKEVDDWVINRPPFSFECKLTNPNNDIFPLNAHLHVYQILIGGKDLYLTLVKKNYNAPQEVDLFFPSSDGSDISVRDIILNKSSKKKEIIMPNVVKLFKNSKRFSVGQQEEVMVSYIKDPFHICVQMLQNVGVFQKMKNEITEYYNRKTTSCVPIEGTNVIIKYEHDSQGTWHRARIISVNNYSQTAQVYFVDWGGEATVPWSNIRLLKDEFARIECQVIIVKLADIQRGNENEPWPQKVTDFLKQQVAKENRLKMIVNNVDPLEVALFQVSGGNDICLNTLLVEHKHAVSTGHITQTLYWPNQTNEQMETEEDDNEMCTQLINNAQQILIDNEVEYEEEYRDASSIKVEVVRFESPDQIFLKFLKYKEKYEEMHNHLQIHYGLERIKMGSFKRGTFCVVYDMSESIFHGKYFRGVVKDKSRAIGDAYKVYLYDQARDIEVEKKFIFEYNRYFQKYGCYVCKCQLSGLRPAGDQGTWSKLATEILQKMFRTYKGFHVVVTERNTEEKKFGVVMWYMMTKTLKALEPSSQHLISINRIFIEAGVAFADNGKRMIDIKENCLDRHTNEKDIDESSILSSDEVVENSTHTDFNKNWYELICEDEQQNNTCSLNEWDKPPSLERKEFNAILTCIDTEGCFSVRDEEQQQIYIQVAENMNETLNQLDLKPEIFEWEPRERCSILYEGDWYRGLIVDVVNEEEVAVEMIDYGSEHTVHKKNVFKHCMFTDMPPLIYKVQLYDVYSNHGAWTPSDIEAVLKIVSTVGEYFRVVIKSDLTDAIPKAEIFEETGFSVNDLIAENCSSMIRHGNNFAVVMTTGSDDDQECNEVEEDTPAELESESKNVNPELDSLAYSYSELPKSPTRHIRMTVLNVLKQEAIFQVVLNVSNEHDRHDQAFETMRDDIQRHALNQPTISNFKVGKPCICWHGQKNRWCRAEIYNIDNLNVGYVTIFFVDCGSLDMVDVTNVKEVRLEWLNLQVHNYLAFINVQLLQSGMAEQVLIQMSNLRDKKITVRIISEDPLRVHLYDAKGLCYQNLINCGILKAM